MHDPYTLDADTTEIDPDRIDKAITDQLFEDDSDLIYQLVDNGVANGIVIIDGVEIGFTLVVDDEDTDC